MTDDDEALVVDVPALTDTVSVRGVITVDSGAPARPEPCTNAAAAVYFTDVSTEVWFYVGLPCDTDWTLDDVVLPAGTYDIVVRGVVRPGDADVLVPGVAIP